LRSISKSALQHFSLVYGVMFLGRRSGLARPHSRLAPPLTAALMLCSESTAKRLWMRRASDGAVLASGWAGRVNANSS
jgi:hypothetical protein